MPLPLYLLAVAVFAMGTSEFVLAGLVPDLAADLDRPVAAVGLATPAFAIGMVVGAPLTAALARRWPARRSLLGFVLVFAATHVVGALAADLPLLLVTRVVAALANAGFLAVALSTATTLVAPERRGRALAILLSGTTLATVLGVPAGALVGTVLGWRATFWAIALLCLPAAVGVLVGVPRRPGGGERPAPSPASAPAPAPAPAPTPSPSLRAELGVLGRPRVVRALALAALVNAATFAGFTFVAPVVVGPAGLAELWVPVALVLFGLGSFAGVTLAGRWVDSHVDTHVDTSADVDPGPRPGAGTTTGGVPRAALVAVPVGWTVLALVAAWPGALLAAVLVQGAVSFGVGTALIARCLREAEAAPTMAGAYATGALNVGAVVGPLVAAGVLTAAGTGALAPLWVGAGLGVAAVVVATATPEQRQSGVSSVRSTSKGWVPRWSTRKSSRRGERQR
ncbi:MFS transporter [Pimelobacter simplex]|uniref:MFS transporter n=1 Tax=Nocardioides simplex TaxID=2045 RepID=UPI0009DE55A4|nr:MFS transporter [Pimelobacter simplex]MCG8153858.1 MFS transporter [Pimelobacter simplex]